MNTYRMKTPASLIADAIDDAMKAFNNGRGIGQSELSRRSGVPQPTISRTLKGKTLPEVNTLSKLLEVLGAGNVKLSQSVKALIPQDEYAPAVKPEAPSLSPIAMRIAMAVNDMPEPYQVALLNLITIEHEKNGALRLTEIQRLSEAKRLKAG